MRIFMFLWKRDSIFCRCFSAGFFYPILRRGLVVFLVRPNKIVLTLLPGNQAGSFGFVVGSLVAIVLAPTCLQEAEEDTM